VVARHAGDHGYPALEEIGFGLGGRGFAWRDRLVRRGLGVLRLLTGRVGAGGLGQALGGRRLIGRLLGGGRGGLGRRGGGRSRGYGHGRGLGAFRVRRVLQVLRGGRGLLGGRGLRGGGSLFGGRSLLRRRGLLGRGGLAGYLGQGLGRRCVLAGGPGGRSGRRHA
jgi:hypothetical protein